MKPEQTFDYIVIGAGASGCVVANRLSTNSTSKVLLLEAGSSDNDPAVQDLTGFVSLWGSDVDWKLNTEEQPGLNGRKVMITQGKLIGGGSSIHAMMYVRGHPLNFDQWNAMGNDGWSYKEVLPYFKKSEDYESGASKFHGVGGPLSVKNAPDPNAVSLAFQNGAVELGFSGPDWDYNGERQENGAGSLQFNITKDNKRSSSGSAFLTPILDRSNLTVETKAEVTRVLFEGTRAVGVEYFQDVQTHQVKTKKEVIICCGAFLSPKLLMLSGIGPAANLKAQGIAVLADLPGVGQNLQDHLQLPIVYKAKKQTPSPIVLSGNVLFIRTRSGMEAAPPDLQIIYSAGVPIALAPVLKFDFPVSIFVPILVQPHSRGYVQLRSANPLDPPIIHPNYLDRDIDIEVFVQAVNLIRRLVNTKAFADMNDGEIAPGPDTDLKAYIRGNASTIWHPAGTCKMGRDTLAVVDPELKVYGVEGLRVADASVMPTVTSGNTYAGCVMIGEKVADMILSV